MVVTIISISFYLFGVLCEWSKQFFLQNNRMVYQSVIGNNFIQIDANRGGGGVGVISCTPSKDFEKFGHKNAINPRNRGPPPP
jgi:hypothetical protein